MQKSYLGIDVSKLTFDVSVITFRGTQKQAAISALFSNDKAGLSSFKIWLETQQVSFDNISLLVIENTGIYHRLIWDFCTANLLPIYIGNAADL